MAGSVDIEKQDINLNYTWLVLDTIRQMRNAAANQERERYVVQTEFALQLLLSYFTPGTRKAIETDFKTLREEIDKIKKEKNLNEISRKQKILNIKVDFADAHRSFCMAALSKVGIIKVMEEGKIDLSTRDINEISHAIRHSGASVKKAIEEAVKPKEGEVDKK